jgi:FkbM family methyltransferase
LKVFIIFFNKFLFYLTNKLGIFHQNLLNILLNKTRKVIYKGVEMEFFIPNPINKYRIKTFSNKEPDTLNWIESFEKESVFWDIGSNIGLYSIYAAKYNNAKVYAFEPSVFNLEYLAKNIHKNSLSGEILIFPLALSNSLSHNLFKMNNPVWGGALSSFGEDYDQNGKNFNMTFQYTIPGLSALNAIQYFKLLPPDYIKIDVDGIEHLIIEGFGKVLNSVNSILVEINDDFQEQSINSKRCLIDAGLVLEDKFYLGSGSQYNQLWVRKK